MSFTVTSFGEVDASKKSAKMNGKRKAVDSSEDENEDEEESSDLRNISNLSLKVQYGGAKIHGDIDLEKKFMAVGRTLNDYLVVEYGSSNIYISSEEGVTKHKIDLKSKKKFLIF